MEVAVKAVQNLWIAMVLMALSAQTCATTPGSWVGPGAEAVPFGCDVSFAKGGAGTLNRAPARGTPRPLPSRWHSGGHERHCCNGLWPT